MSYKDAKWSWGLEQDEVIQDLKRLLCSVPILACPDIIVEFALQIDASNYGLGAPLTQSQNGKEFVIAFASQLLNDAERNHSTPE